eukprot:scaffold5.g787.t1
MSDLQSLFRIRTVTAFVPSWTPETVAHAAAFLEEARKAFEAAGYEVQTVRIATDALAGAASAADAVARATALEAACAAHGVTLVNAGAASDAALLREGAFPRVAAATSHTSCSFLFRPGMGRHEARLLARAIHDVAAATAGAGSFRFGAAFNCQPGIPYFPVAAAGAAPCFAIGTENSALLHEAFRRGAAAAAAAGGCPVAAAGAALRAAMAEAMAPVEALALRLAAAHSLTYAGIDASIAPALEPPHIADAFELLGLGAFGGPGTLAICEAMTAALKALPLRLCGYSGLMLPVCEDLGLAQAASEGRLGLHSILAFSSVCGCGLDTVPVPGISADTPPAEAEALLDATAGVLLDVAAVARRLGKPLSARLLPVPGRGAGERTAYTSPYLVDCNIMRLC